MQYQVGNWVIVAFCALAVGRPAWGRHQQLEEQNSEHATISDEEAKKQQIERYLDCLNPIDALSYNHDLSHFDNDPRYQENINNRLSDRYFFKAGQDENLIMSLCARMNELDTYFERLLEGKTGDHNPLPARAQVPKDMVRSFQLPIERLKAFCSDFYDVRHAVSETENHVHPATFESMAKQRSFKVPPAAEVRTAWAYLDYITQVVSTRQLTHLYQTEMLPDLLNALGYNPEAKRILSTTPLDPRLGSEGGHETLVQALRKKYLPRVGCPVPDAIKFPPTLEEIQAAFKF